MTDGAVLTSGPWAIHLLGYLVVEHLAQKTVEGERDGLASVFHEIFQIVALEKYLATYRTKYRKAALPDGTVKPIKPSLISRRTMYRLSLDNTRHSASSLHRDTFELFR
jgi:hypothetical protein